MRAFSSGPHVTKLYGNRVTKSRRDAQRLRRHLICLVAIVITRSMTYFGSQTDLGGDVAVGAYGIQNRLILFIVMAVIGLNQGMQPIAGYNYGSQQIDRLMKVLRLAMITATVIMIVGWLIAMLLPYYCARLFTQDPTLIKLSVHAIRINMLVFPVIGCQMVITNFFQCIGKVQVSIFLSLSRQLLFLLPLLLVLPHIWGIDGVWYALPASDATAFIVAFIIMSRYMRKLKNLQAQKLTNS